MPDQTNQAIDTPAPLTVETPFTMDTQRSDQYRAIYANVCHVTTSAWDLQIMLGRAEESAGKLKLIDEARVYLSPAQAKAFSNVLEAQIKLYEINFGEIKVPQAVLNPVTRPLEKNKAP